MLGIVIEGPSNVTYIPGQTPLPIELICNITGVFVTWRVNGSTYLPGNLIANPPSLAGHSANGDNILIMDPLNNTEYICVSNIPNTPGSPSPPAFLYIACEFVNLQHMHVMYMFLVNDFYLKNIQRNRDKKFNWQKCYPHKF